MSHGYPALNSATATASDNKYAPPDAAGLVARTRLSSILDSAPPRGVIWMAAPPGAGKSSLAAGWMKTRHAVDAAGALWYQIDDNDSDPVGFFSHFRQVAGNGLGLDIQTLPRLTPDAQRELQPFARRWFKELRAATPLPWRFVFDDVHRLVEDGDTWDLLFALCAAMKSSDRILFLSRRPPGDAFKRHVAPRRQVRVDDLTVHAEDFDDFAGAAGGALSQASFLERLRLTGGWISELTGKSGTGGSMHPGDRDMEMGRGELLDVFTPEQRDVLLRTAFLQVGDDEEWHALGGAPAVALLQRLAREHNFVSGMANGSLRKHDLFHERLLDTALRTLPSDDRNGAMRAAARAYAARREPAPAVRLLLQAQAPQEALELVLAEAPASIQEGRNRELIDLIEMLPASLKSQPLPRIWLASARQPYEPRAARQAFREVRQSLAAEAAPHEYFLSITGEIQAVLSEWAEPHALQRLVAEMDALSHAVPTLPPVLRVRVAVARSMAMMLGWPTHPEIIDTVRQVEKLLVILPPAQHLLVGGALASYLIWWRGDVRAARPHLSLLKKLTSSPDLPPVSVMLWYYGAIACAAREGDDATLRRLTHEAEAFARRWGVTHRLSNVFWINVQAYADAGDAAEAERMLQRYIEHMVPGRPADLMGVHHLRAAMALGVGDPHGAVAEARQARAYAETQAGPHQVGNQDMLLSLALAMSDDPAARAHIEQLRAVSRITHNANFVLHAELAEVYLAHARGDEHQFAAAWPRMARAACRQGDVRITGMNREHLARLANDALIAGIDIPTTLQLAELWRLRPPRCGIVSAKWKYPIEIRSLGAFGIDVNGQRIGTGRGRAQHKPLELLWWLVSAGEDGVAQEDLADGLWPGLDGDRAIVVLRTTVYRLRKLLGAEAIRHEDEQIALSMQIVRTDLDQWERAMEEVRDAHLSQDRRLVAFEEALQLYQGRFLPGVDLPAVAAKREQIETTFAAQGCGFLREMPGKEPASRMLAKRLSLCLEGAPAELREDVAAMTAWS
jgi:ATP/maltotriose-dependent transcriptional regulator MalT